jgi:hypothetical protein
MEDEGRRPSIEVTTPDSNSSWLLPTSPMQVGLHGSPVGSPGHSSSMAGSRTPTNNNNSYNCSTSTSMSNLTFDQPMDSISVDSNSTTSTTNTSFLPNFELLRSSVSPSRSSSMSSSQSQSGQGMDLISMAFNRAELATTTTVNHHQTLSTGMIFSTSPHFEHNYQQQQQQVTQLTQL